MTYTVKTIHVLNVEDLRIPYEELAFARRVSWGDAEFTLVDPNDVIDSLVESGFSSKAEQLRSLLMEHPSLLVALPG